MSVSKDHDKLVAAFRPTDVPWKKVESMIALRKDPATLAGPSLQGLTHRSMFKLKTDGAPKMLRIASRVESVQKLGAGMNELATTTSQVVDPIKLRLPDLLFCELEAPVDELARRRTRLWELFLKPMTRHVCTSRKVSPAQRPRMHATLYLVH